MAVFHQDYRINEAKHISRYTNELTWIFASTPSKYRAHEKSQPILKDISNDELFLRALLQRYLLNPEVLNKKNFPIVRMDVELNPYYHLVAHCWIPLADRNTDVSAKAIHHHGYLLLTTTNTFGPGYEHWTFSQAKALDGSRDLYAMEVTGRGTHVFHNTAFVDAYEPHVPMYPPGLTITLALWSTWKQVTWKDHLKRMSFIRKNKEILKQMARYTGTTDFLGIQEVEYFDYYPVGGGFKGMKSRIEYPLGPNEDHLYNLFHILQQTRSDVLAPMVEQHLVSGEVRLDNAPTIQQLVLDLKAGHPIEGRLSACHQSITHLNYTSRDIEQAVEATQSPTAWIAPQPAMVEQAVSAS